MKKRNRDSSTDDAGQDVMDVGNSIAGPKANTGICEVDAVMEQNNLHGGEGFNDSDSSPPKRRKKDKKRGADDAARDVADYIKSRRGHESVELVRLGDDSGITYADASSSKKKRKTKQRNCESEIAGRDVGHNVNIDCGRELNEAIWSGKSAFGSQAKKGIGEDDGVIKQDISTGGLGMNCVWASAPHIAKEDDGVSSSSDGGCESNGKSGVGDAIIPQSLSASKKKKRRKEENQKSFHHGKNGRDIEVGRDESESNEKTRITASEILKPVRSQLKGESRKKKTVRFQEPATEPDGNVSHEKDVEADVEFFSEGRGWTKDSARDDLRYGRFTKEEDEKIRSSVYNYIKMQRWDEKEGLQIVLRPSKYPQGRCCWLEIAKCLPIRPIKQINARAMRLLGDYKRGYWSAEEVVELEKLHKVHGNNWISIASSLGRSADLCKDKWRHTRLYATRNTGLWAQDEYDKLCKLVRRSLTIKASLPPKLRNRRQYRDDISWDWIADEMQRNSARCSEVWYERLASPMISSKKWANGDDHLLLQRLMELGATSEEALDWDSIIDHRDGGICMRRWLEMARLLGRNDHASFEDKLELLAKRYAPDLLGIEEEF